MPKAVALLVAAGSGERLGASRPKAFVMLAGRPMLEWSVAALRAAGLSEIVVALPEGVDAPSGCLGVRGGETRSESVRAALAAAGPGDVVVHDAARPARSSRPSSHSVTHAGGSPAATAPSAESSRSASACLHGIFRLGHEHW